MKYSINSKKIKMWFKKKKVINPFVYEMKDLMNKNEFTYSSLCEECGMWHGVDTYKFTKGPIYTLKLQGGLFENIGWFQLKGENDFISLNEDELNLLFNNNSCN